ncbi:MAG: hypothetical protein JW709_08675 [Sedimentisphaerales bacterium]|nr:hypothetical protein [Sedimentisphaerales bacterium]
MAEVKTGQGTWRHWAVSAGLLLGAMFILGAGPMGWKAGRLGLTAWIEALAVCWIAGVLSLLPAALVENRGAERLVQVSLLITGLRPMLTLAAGVGWYLTMRPMMEAYVAGILAGYLLLLAWETRLILLLARKLMMGKHCREFAAKKVDTCGLV